jgi:hypothetical protein
LLDAVHADVSVTGLGVLGEDSTEGDVAAGAARGGLCGGGVEDLAGVEIAIEGPALDDGKFVEIGFIALEDDLLADAGADGFWGEAAELEEVGELLHFFHQRCWDFWFYQCLDAVGQVGEGLRAEGVVDAPVGAKGVDGDGDVGVLDVLEEEGFAAEVGGGGAVELCMGMWSFGFGDAVGDGGDFEFGVDFGGDFGELALLVEEVEEVGESWGGHGWKGKRWAGGWKVERGK